MKTLEKGGLVREVAQGSTTLIGRVLLVLLFLMSAVLNKIPNFAGTVKSLEAEGVPMPQVSLVIAIVLLIVGSLSIILGYKARWGAAMLLVFLLLASFFYHDFWNFPPDVYYMLSTDRSQQLQVARVETINFMKNMALMGAMLIIMANGSGVMSLDDWKPKGDP